MDQNEEFLAASSRKLFWLVVIIAFVLFFAQTTSFMLLFDGLTYTALAKNILKTGDWKTLHYGVEQYPDFYQHPPLAIWLQALVMKGLGTSEWVTRLLPSTCGVLTVAGVFEFTRRKFGVNAAFWAGVVLFTSTRFIKWGSNFYLDGILGFFCFASFALWMIAMDPREERVNRDRSLKLSGEEQKLVGDQMPAPQNVQLQTRLENGPKQAVLSDFILPFLSGLSLAFAFMTKGAVAFSTLAVVLFSVLFFFRVRTFLKLAVFALGAALPILLWMRFANGAYYLEQYFALSVKSRVGFQWVSGPWNNLKSVWWPWWPVCVLSLWVTFLHLRARKFSLFIVFCSALVFPVGFSLGSGYLEHYLTPFYPFAAVLVGVQLSHLILVNRKIAQGFALVIAILTLFLATLSFNMNAQKSTKAMRWIREIRTLPETELSVIRKVVFTDAAGELWINLAGILGRTDWQSVGAFAPTRKSEPGTILIAATDERVDPSWHKIECLYVPGSVFYAQIGAKFCE